MAPVWTGEQALTSLHKRQPYKDDTEPPLQALAYETERREEAKGRKNTVTWTERLRVVYSPRLARRARRGGNSGGQMPQMRGEP